MAEKKSTPFYHSWIRNFERIGKIDKATGFDLMISLLRHGASGEGLKIDDESSAVAFTAELLFNDYAETIDRDAVKYEKRCEQNRTNVSKRYQSNTNVYERKRSNTNATDIDIDIDKDIDIDIDVRKRTKSKNKFKNFDERTYTDEEYAAMEGGRKP